MQWKIGSTYLSHQQIVRHTRAKIHCHPLGSCFGPLLSSSCYSNPRSGSTKILLTITQDVQPVPLVPEIRILTDLLQDCFQYPDSPRPMCLLSLIPVHLVQEGTQLSWRLWTDFLKWFISFPCQSSLSLRNSRSFPGERGPPSWVPSRHGLRSGATIHL